MLRQIEPVSSVIEQTAIRVSATPSYLGHGMAASLATHAIVAGGYSLLLLAASWVTSANLPEWMPPQSGVQSRPQKASEAIVLEAAFQEPVERETRPVTLRRPTDRPPEPDPPLDAVETRLERFLRAPPVPTRTRNWNVSGEAESDPQDDAERPREDRTRRQTEERLANQEPPSAQVARREHGLAIQTISSVASVSAQESHGAETDALPQSLFNPEPDYPARQYREHIGGTVRIRIHLGDDGRVTAASVFKTSGVAALDQAALKAVRRWRFEPVSTARPTAREIIFPIRFEPSE